MSKYAHRYPYAGFTLPAQALDIPLLVPPYFSPAALKLGNTSYVSRLITFATFSQKQKEVDPKELLQRFENAAEEVLCEDLQRVSQT